jgi:hypothetical protein
VEWFHVTAYGAREVDYQDPEQNPTKCRANTLLNMKKAVSHYMPEKGMPFGTVLTGIQLAMPESTR